ncbi:MAG: OmpA family protein [Bacteroidota bacterium]
MKQLYLCIILCLSFIGLNAQGISLDTVFFRFNEAELDKGDRQQLDSLIGIFTAYPAYYIEILGHTDSIGSTAYNLDLSKERAKNVALYLNSQGVEFPRVTYVGMGTTKPIGDNLTFAGRTKNRRAEIAVIYSNEVVKPVYEEDTVIAEEVIVGPVLEEKVYPIDTIYCDYFPFMINPRHQSVIITPRGSKLIVPGDAFVTDEPEVEMEISELFERKEMLQYDISTMAKEGPLEVQGTFSFDAKAGRRALKIAPGTAFQVELPSSRRDQDMKVYSGNGSNRKRKRSRKQEPIPKPWIGEDGDPGFAAAKTWRPIEDNPVKYLGREKAYRFDVYKPGRYAVGRELFHSQNVDPKNEGINIQIKLKGRRFPNSTTVMLAGEIVKTYIPLKAKNTRIFEGSRVKWLDPKTKLILVAIQYDDKGTPYLVKRSFVPRDYIKNEKNRKKKKKRKKTRDLPKAKLKAKFRKMDADRLEELLIELNGANEKVGVEQ